MRLLPAVFAAILVLTCATIDPPALAQGMTLKGEVLEVQDVESYTYLRLKTADGETWAAVNKSPVAKGSQVLIEHAAVMTNFESKTLHRKFDKIVFGTLAASGSGDATASATGAPPANGSMAAMHAGMAKPVDIGSVKVAKAAGSDAKTVAEIVAGGAQLKGKTVVVRAKVVKVTPGVMGKNWVHVRDGSGSASDGTNDVLVTTQDESAVGDVVLVKGVVHTDVNLGSGYAFKVLVEEASVKKEKS